MADLLVTSGVVRPPNPAAEEPSAAAADALSQHVAAADINGSSTTDNRSSSTQTAAAAASATFSIGEMVAVKRVKSASWQIATILAVPNDKEHPASHQYHGRYQVKFANTGLTYFVREASIRAYVKPPARVLVAETTQHYRSAAFTYAHPDDVVLEVGCHEGVTTDILHQRCKWVLGIDKCWDPVARARAKYPHCRFERIDGFDTAALAALSPTGRFDKIYIDIGGIAELHIVMSLVGLYYRTFPKSVLIVKNKFMKSLLGNCQVYLPHQEIKQKQQQHYTVTKKERKQMRKQMYQQQQWRQQQQQQQKEEEGQWQQQQEEQQQEEQQQEEQQ